jgi:hypothetical protein
MTDFARPLDVARRDLAERVQVADEAGDWQERAVLVHLATVADMVCRIGDHTHSAHYRADKSGVLVDAALRVQFECLNAYLVAGQIGDEEEPAGRVEAANDVLEAVASVVRMVMWAQARAGHGGAEIYASDARRIRRAKQEFDRWAEAICSSAVPDPVDE